MEKYQLQKWNRSRKTQKVALIILIHTSYRYQKFLNLISGSGGSRNFKWRGSAPMLEVEFYPERKRGYKGV